MKNIFLIRILICCLASIVALPYYTYAQCDFKVTAVQQKESDCQSNGIIKATLSGGNVDNGNVDANDAQFSVESTVLGGYSMVIPEANGGIMVNIPPGTYIVTAKAYCKAKGTWVFAHSNVVTVTGSYTIIDRDKTVILSDQIEKSLKCTPTGVVPIKIVGGKAPYTITITSAPPEYTGPMTFPNIPAGVFRIEHLPSGNYSFRLRDDCTYDVPLGSDFVGVINPEFSLGAIKPSHTCLFEGQIPVNVAKGSEPYTITITSAPASYTGNTSFTVPTTGTYVIDSLPAGNYSLTVTDDCGYTKTFAPTVAEIKPTAKAQNVTQTISCGTTGAVDLNLQNGVPPYNVVMSGAASGTFTYNASGIYTISNLADGVYNFSITDSCYNVLNLTATIAISKLDVKLKATSASSSCLQTGSLSFDVKGGKAPYSITLTSYPAAYTGAVSFTQATAGTFALPSIPAGTYEFTIVDACGESQSIPISVDILELTTQITITGKSLGCLGTGSFSITIGGGTKPYIVTIDAYPPAYTGPFTFPLANPGKLPIPDLPQGGYTITVTDFCGVDTTVNLINIDKIAISNDLPNDPFEEYFYPPTTLDADCQDLRVKRKPSSSIGGYWNTNSSKYYEVCFLYDGIGTCTSWVPVTEYINYTLPNPETYKTVRDGNHYVVAYIRLKNDPLCSGTGVDTIWLKPIITDINPPYNQSCSGYSFSFQQRTNQDGIICYPYNWRLIDSLNNVVRTGINVTTAGKQTVTGVLPYGTLKLEFTDAAGQVWTETVTSYWKNPTNVTLDYADFTCFTYSATFDDPKICYPYKWELRRPNNSVFASRAVSVKPATKEKINGLIYNTTYDLYVITNQNDTTIFPVFQDKKFTYNYKIEKDAGHCQVDLGKGYIRIFRDALIPTFTMGTRIRYISGPSVPHHADITLDSTQNNLKELFPFSTDTIVNKRYENIKQGTYVFEITDTCNVKHPLNIAYEFYSIDSMTYTKKETCSGVDIYPTGNIYLGGTPQPAYFRIKSAPQGIAVNPHSVPSGGVLFLPESGEYVIQMSAEDSDNSCLLDSVVIQYVKRQVSLDKDATKAYICTDDTPGYIRVRAQGGVGPYNYTLIDAGVEIETNTLGIFQYGVAGATYAIRIEDVGCQVSFEQNVTMLNLSKERLVFGSQDVCIGAPITLNCAAVSPTYIWEGPNGYTSNIKNPIIDTATLASNGIYKIAVQPEGCLKSISQEIDIRVHQPDMPYGDTVNIQCLGSPSSPLTATVLPNHHLQWYAPDGVTPLPHAPSPSTAAVDTITYYVTQISDDMGCESNKFGITAIISDLPDSVSVVYAPDICPGVVPVFIIPHAYKNYTYNLYTSAKGGQLEGTGIGASDTLKIAATTPITVSTRYYIEVLNDNQCASLKRTPVDVTVVDYVYIKPLKIPSYEREKPYVVQLQTNAAPPYTFTELTPMPAGFYLSNQGEITGSAPRNGKIDPHPFTVKVVDADGCVAIKEYELSSDVFTPQAFTPNGDGKNDHFMKGKRLIIFDRLGVKIFEGTDGWDGSRNGKPAPADTYFYIVYYTNDDGMKAYKTGYITLLRRK